MKLDQTDKKIIQLLGADARMSNNQMAKVIGVTEGTVRNRIQKLIKNRVGTPYLIKRLCSSRQDAALTHLGAPLGAI